MEQLLSDERVAEAGACERAIRAERRVAVLEAALREERARRDAAEAALAALAKREGLVLDCRAATTLESLAESVAPASVSLFPETLAGLIGGMRSATRIRADNDRLRALLRRWVTWSVTEPHGYLCRCGAYGDTPQRAPHTPTCIVGDTLKALEGTNDDATERWAEIEAHVMRTGPTDLDHVIGTALMAPDLVEECRRLRARVAVLEGVLRSVEWGNVGACPYCCRGGVHRPDCALDAALNPTPSTD